jgi:hypothetical protein
MTTQPSNQKGVVERALATTSGDEESALLTQLFPSDETLAMKTELSPNLILPIAKAKLIAKIMKSGVLEDYLQYLQTSLISKDRRGRHELLEALTAMRHRDEDEY